MNWTEWPSYYWIIFIVALVALNIPRLKTMKKVADSRKKQKDKSLTPEKLKDMTFLKECVAKDPFSAKMKRKLDKLVENKLDFIPVYGYKFEDGIMTKTIYNYMLGFNPGQAGFLVVPIKQKGTPIGEPYLIDESRADSFKYMLDGSLKITFPDGESIAIIFPPITGEDDILPEIDQTEIVMSFKEYLNTNFTIKSVI